MERAAESLFFYSAAAEGFGSWCCVDYGYDVLYLDHPEKNRSQQHTGLVSDSKAKVYGFAFGFCSPPCSLKIISCTNTMTFLPTSSSKHRCQHNFVSSRAQHAKQV